MGTGTRIGARIGAAPGAAAGTTLGAATATPISNAIRAHGDHIETAPDPESHARSHFLSMDPQAQITPSAVNSHFRYEFFGSKCWLPMHALL